MQENLAITALIVACGSLLSVQYWSVGFTGAAVVMILLVLALVLIQLFVKPTETK